MSQQTGASPDRKKPRVGEKEHPQSANLNDLQAVQIKRLKSRLNHLQMKRNMQIAKIEEDQRPDSRRRKALAVYEAQIKLSDRPSDETQSEIDIIRQRVEKIIQKAAEKSRDALALTDKMIGQVEEDLRLAWKATPSKEDSLFWAIQDSDDDGDGYDLEQVISNHISHEKQRLENAKAAVGNNAGLMCEVSLFLRLGNELHRFCVAVGSRRARKIRCEYLLENMKYIANTRSGKKFLQTVHGLDKALATIAAEERSDVEASSEITLKYPFGACGHVSSQQLDDISNDMIELGGKVISSIADNKTAWAADERGVLHGMFIADPSPDSSIIQCDNGTMRLLSSWQYMNNSFVDLFMRWITRKENPATSSILIFPGSFFGLLYDEGPEAGSSWANERSIDIFTKRFVLLPINENCLTTSLCVIVNPNFITNEYKDEEDQSDDQDFPFILYFDPLGVSQKVRCSKIVRKWLNYEAKRFGKFTATFEAETRDGGAIFNTRTMEIFGPKVPCSTNLIDAGMYVCRYAYALYLMREKQITYGRFGFEEQYGYCRELITESNEFNFGDEDIKRMGQEMKTLVERLSAM